MTGDNVSKCVVSVTEMAKMLGLSRARFYQLMGSAFPRPLYDVRTRRPFFVEELQKVCLEVRRRNCGIDGKPVLFYAKGHRGSPPTKPGRKKAATHGRNEFPDILDGVQALGLAWATTAQVASAMRTLFPQGVVGKDQSEVVRAVFLHLRRQNPGDNVGR